jgi:uroporphyrinogen-III synthase
VQAPPDPALLAALAAGEIDVVTFTSSSTVTNLLALVEETADGRRQTAEGRDPLGGALVACIGPVTAQTARERGLRVDVVAAEHSIPGLVAALVQRAMSDER